MKDRVASTGNHRESEAGMAWYPEDAPLPAGLQTPDFVLRPLTPADADHDFAAMCDRWDTKDWVDFTWEGNHEALVHHEQEHQQREAFTFTMTDSANTVCLGCVYIEPLERLIPDELQLAMLAAGVPRDAVAVRFWVRDAYLGGEVSTKLLQALQEWFASAWQLPPRIFHTRHDDPYQNVLYPTLGFTHILDLPIRYGRLYVQLGRLGQ
jgi:RimJ/RimL family protein N-acetyltransferase